jgi:hypothetical protein
MALKFPNEIASLRVPEADRAVVITRSESLSVERPRYAIDPATLHVGSSPKQVPGKSVPDADSTVHGRRCDHPSLRRPSNPADWTLMPTQYVMYLTSERDFRLRER